MSSDSEKPAEAKPEEKPVELPAFEKSISDKIVEKFGDKVEVTFVKLYEYLWQNHTWLYWK